MDTEWTNQTPTLDGVYLTKFDKWDEDDEAETYHLRNGGFFTPDGRPWFVYGGIWKRIGDLPA